MWTAGALVSAVMLALIGWQLAKPRDLYTGTNSVRPRSIAAVVPPRVPLCIPDLDVPARTGRIELDVITELPQPRLDVAVRTAAGTFAGAVPGPPRKGQYRILVPIRQTPAEPDFVKGTACVSARAPLAFTGVIGSDASAPPRIGSRPVGHGSPSGSGRPTGCATATCLSSGRCSNGQPCSGRASSALGPTS